MRRCIKWRFNGLSSDFRSESNFRSISKLSVEPSSSMVFIGFLYYMFPGMVDIIELVAGSLEGTILSSNKINTFIVVKTTSLT